MATLKVVVFGSTGAGKTSLCNVLSGHEMPASDSARGVTFQSFEFPPFEYGGHTVTLTDTVGLNESEKGHIRPIEAVQQLVDLIKRSADGYHLLVHVMRAPRITHHTRITTNSSSRLSPREQFLVCSSLQGVRIPTLWPLGQATTSRNLPHRVLNTKM